jgi:hypothetical protein
MKNRFAFAAAALLVSAVFLVAQPPAGAPAGAGKGAPGAGKGKGKGGPPAYQPPEGPAPKLANGKPSMNGVWSRPFSQNVEQAYGKPLPYTPVGKKAFDEYNAENGDYTGSCLPFGHNRSMNGPDPVQFIQTDDQFAFLYEQNTWFKVLPTDGRAHNPRKVPTWYGDSVGHYEGDTLVIVTKNFNGYTKIDTNGHPHSEKMVLTEKFNRRDLGHIDYEITVDDPVNYTEPWTIKKVFTLRTDWQIQEYSCEENNKGVYEGRIKPPTYMNK